MNHKEKLHNDLIKKIKKITWSGALRAGVPNGTLAAIMRKDRVTYETLEKYHNLLDNIQNPV